MAEIEATDRYGGNYPDPKTVCQGPCEGMGTYPAYSPGHDTRDPPIPGAAVGRAMDDDTALIEASGATPGPDGWAFLKCPDCGGTGKRPAPTKEHIEGLEIAWGIIANVSSGDWSRSQEPEWIIAAEAWRDEVWHPALTAYIDAHPEKVVERVFGEGGGDDRDPRGDAGAGPDGAATER